MNGSALAAAMVLYILTALEKLWQTSCRLTAPLQVFPAASLRAASILGASHHMKAQICETARWWMESGWTTAIAWKLMWRWVASVRGCRIETKAILLHRSLPALLLGSPWGLGFHLPLLPAPHSLPGGNQQLPNPASRSGRGRRWAISYMVTLHYNTVSAS